MSGIESVVESCDGVNFDKMLHQLALVNFGKLNSLSYRGQMEQFVYETEFVALRMIFAAVGEWVARRMHEKRPDTHPCGNHNTWWKHHPRIYTRALQAARDCRLRTLGLLMKCVLRQQPQHNAVERLMHADDEKVDEEDGGGGGISPGRRLLEKFTKSKSMGATLADEVVPAAGSFDSTADGWEDNFDNPLAARKVSDNDDFDNPLKSFQVSSPGTRVGASADLESSIWAEGDEV